MIVCHRAGLGGFFGIRGFCELGSAEDEVNLGAKRKLPRGTKCTRHSKLGGQHMVARGVVCEAKRVSTTTIALGAPASSRLVGEAHAATLRVVRGDFVPPGPAGSRRSQHDFLTSTSRKLHNCCKQRTYRYGWQGQTALMVARATSHSFRCLGLEAYHSLPQVFPGSEQGQGVLVSGGGGISSHHQRPDELPRALPLPPADHSTSWEFNLLRPPQASKGPPPVRPGWPRQRSDNPSPRLPSLP